MLRQQGRLAVRVGANSLSTFVTICDNGQGIPNDLIKGLFQPYVTGSVLRNGVGTPVVLADYREASRNFAVPHISAPRQIRKRVFAFHSHFGMPREPRLRCRLLLFVPQTNNIKSDNLKIGY
jgi:hypothetical protein